MLERILCVMSWKSLLQSPGSVATTWQEKTMTRVDNLEQRFHSANLPTELSYWIQILDLPRFVSQQ